MEYKVGDRVRVINPRQASYVEGKQHWKEGDEVEVLFLNQYDKELIYIGNKGDDWTENKACFQTKGLELIKEDTMETQVKPVYKVVRIEDGRYYSIYCGSEVAPNFETQLEYTIGGVTKSPTGSEGIFCYTTKEKAIRDYIEFHSIVRSSKPLAILECYPIGIVRGSPIQPKPEGVYVKAEVWKEEESRPEPKFKVGNRVKPIYGEPFTITQALWADKNGKYDWSGHKHWHYAKECAGGVLGGYWYDEDSLELAPVEEWVDVTKECTLDMSFFYNRISVIHGGSERVLLANKAYRWLCVGGHHPDPDYKVELEEEGQYPCGGFRVYKKK